MVDVCEASSAPPRRAASAPWSPLLLLFLAFTPPLMAEPQLAEAGIGFRVRGGDGSLYVGGREGGELWLPCEVVLTHEGPEPWEGTLVLREALHLDGGRPAMRYEQALRLAPGARQRFAFPVLYHQLGRYVLELEQGGRTRRLMPGGLAPHLQSGLAPLVLVARERSDVIESAPFPEFLRHLHPPPGGAARAKPLLVDMDPAQLPTWGAVYEGVSLLVLDDLWLEGLEPVQQEAILAYVAEGGALWVSALKRDPGSQGPLATALPGRREEARRLGDIAALEAAVGTPCQLPHPRRLSVFQPAPDAQAWDPQDPVLVHRRLGQGLIVLAGFRFAGPVFRDWPDAHELLSDILEVRAWRPPQLARLEAHRLERALDAPLRGTTAKTVPPRRELMLLLGVYLLLVVPLPYLLFRRAGRLELAWLLIAVLGLLGAGAVYALGQSRLLPARAVRVSLVEGVRGPGPQPRRSHWSIFSRDGGALLLRFARDTRAVLAGEAEAQPVLRGDTAELLLRDAHPQDSILASTRERVEFSGALRVQPSGKNSAHVERVGTLPLLGLWAWRPDARRYSRRVEELTLSHPPLEKEPPLDPAQAALLVAVQADVQEQVLRRKRALLLYRTRGAPGLAPGSIPEWGLDLGLLEFEWSEGPSLGRRSDAWLPARLAPLRRPFLKQGEVRFAHLVPPGLTVRQLALDFNRHFHAHSRRRPQVQNPETGGWGAAPSRFRPDGVLRRSPLGIAHGRLRVERDALDGELPFTLFLLTRR